MKTKKLFKKLQKLCVTCEKNGMQMIAIVFDPSTEDLTRFASKGLTPESTKAMARNSGTSAMSRAMTDLFASVSNIFALSELQQEIAGAQVPELKNGQRQKLERGKSVDRTFTKTGMRPGHPSAETGKSGSLPEETASASDG